MDAVAMRWELHQTPWEILERQGSAFLLDMLKTNAITQHSNKSAVGMPWQCSENFINAVGTPRARRKIVVQMPWRPWSSHGVSTALIRRVYGVFTACCLSYSLPVAFARRCHDVHGARVALLPRPMAFL